MQLWELLSTLLQGSIKPYKIGSKALISPAAAPHPRSQRRTPPSRAQTVLAGRKHALSGRRGPELGRGQDETRRQRRARAASAGRLLARRYPRGAGAGPGARHCGKGVGE